MLAEVGVQIGLGPSPPPDPLLTISSTVPKTNRPRTSTVVVTIQLTWTPRLALAAFPPTGSAIPFREARHVISAYPMYTQMARMTGRASRNRTLKSVWFSSAAEVMRPRRHVGSDEEVEEHVPDDGEHRPDGHHPPEVARLLTVRGHRCGGRRVSLVGGRLVGAHDATSRKPPM